MYRKLPDAQTQDRSGNGIDIEMCIMAQSGTTTNTLSPMQTSSQLILIFYAGPASTRLSPREECVLQLYYTCDHHPMTTARRGRIFRVNLQVGE
jgi:hypothetical protein